MTRYCAFRLLPVAVAAFLLSPLSHTSWPYDPPAEQAMPTANATALPAEVLRDRAGLLARLGIDRWHAAGHRGAGVTVAVLDTGFRGYRSYLGTALPSSVRTQSFRLDGELEARDSQHGILCGEVIHTLAPDAELLFVTWEPDRPDTFVQAVAWAKDQGARIVSCSVIMPSWSDGEGGGPVHADLMRVAGDGQSASDLLCSACAGNIAQRHWYGGFRPDSLGYHQWQAGERDNGLTPWGEEERVSVELCWPAGSSYSVSVHEASTGTEIGRAPLRAQSGGHCAVVRFAPAPGKRYTVRVRHTGGPEAPFHLAALGAWLDRYTQRSSIPFPGDGPEFLAVGALEPTGRRAIYSSCGPNSSVPKPDFVAPVPVLTACRGKPFAGTSAAAPQAAALAAVCLSRHPDWSPDRVRAYLRKSATDISPPGHDWETGYGILRLPIDP
ncbi:MAG TPA: S8 family serine peptidase [Gemmataceae bacterium]|jgi:subtilisin family serine protease|nr:S8 family serine peptidase [Gemmataceae bacterium]